MLLKTSLKKAKVKKNQQIENKKRSLPLFSVTDDNLDVFVNRNIQDKWEGFLFSQLREDYEGRRLLQWVLKGDFDDRVKELAEEFLNGL